MRQRFTRGLKGASVFTLLALVLAGCTQQSMLGWMPTERGLTNQVDRVIDLWVVSWVVLLVIGVITWILIIWAAVVYRRRHHRCCSAVPLHCQLHFSSLAICWELCQCPPACAWPAAMVSQPARAAAASTSSLCAVDVRVAVMLLVPRRRR